MHHPEVIRADSTSRSRRVSLVTFDRGWREDADVLRPDRYRVLEAAVGGASCIARGGGYSYAAASFGAGSRVIDMSRFNRVLRFDPGARLVEVEAGITLGDLLRITAPAQLWLPVQPGYPAITIGGCIAPNIHGKNPARSGTFRHSVVDITLCHPRFGTLRVDATNHPQLFELTCGGFGLTGVIVAATLRLEPLPGSRLSMRRVPLDGLSDGLACLRVREPDNAFTYTWHDVAPGAASFGRGVAYEGAFVLGPARLQDIDRSYRRIDPLGWRVPLSGWNAWTTGAFNRVYRWLEGMKPVVEELSIFDSLFPFARRPAIFLLFGQPGFIEYQALVPDRAAEDYLDQLTRAFRRGRLPSVLVSMKRFNGTPRWLRFEGEGVCITTYLARTRAAREYLPRLDALAGETGSIVNIMKDSRLPTAVVRALYPEYEDFRAALRQYDPDRLCRSELSERLEL